MLVAVTLAIALALTAVIAGASILAGFIAAMPDGTIAHGVTPRLRAELYIASVGLPWITGQAWLSLATRAS